MALWLGAPAAFAEELGLFRSTHLVAHGHLMSLSIRLLRGTVIHMTIYICVCVCCVCMYVCVFVLCVCECVVCVYVCMCVCLLVWRRQVSVL